MELTDDGRLAVMYLNDDILEATGTTPNDTEGLINLPLTAREIQAVVFFKLGADGDVRISMRSKYDVDVRSVASRHGGGGHKNAAGFTMPGPLTTVRAGVVQEIKDAIAAGMRSRP
jgi:phosphoesterase RecJ-like protein